MKLVIYTQYMENYGAHDWDGQGSCPQYWKSKGGSTYVVDNLTQSEADDFIKNHFDKLSSLICYSHDAAQEYIISHQIVEDDCIICDSWESPYCISLQGDTFIASCIMKNDEYGYMNKKIVEKHTSYTMLENGKRDNYQCKYLLNSGAMVSEENISKHLQ